MFTPESFTTEGCLEGMGTDEWWEEFRSREYPAKEINLNVAQLAPLSTTLQRAIQEFHQSEVGNFPLGNYRQGAHYLQSCKEIAARLWKVDERAFTVGGATTVLAEQIATALVLRRKKRDQLVVVTSPHEHFGGIGAFVGNPFFKVHTLSEASLWSEDSLAQELDSLTPDVLLLSQVTYTFGEQLPLAALTHLFRERSPNGWVIIDAAQALGYLNPPFHLADVTIASTHKWLMGPHGLGMVWMSDRAIEEFPILPRAGQPHDPSLAGQRFSFAGGFSFCSYLQLLFSLVRLERLGCAQLRRRSVALTSRLRHLLVTSLKTEGVVVRKGESAPVTSRHRSGYLFSLHFDQLDPYPIYQELNSSGVYVKCIKKTLPGGRQISALRFGVPFYESPSRVDRAAEIIVESVVKKR